MKASAFSSTLRSGASARAAAKPACWLVTGTTTTCFSESSAARSAAMMTFALLGSTTTSSAATSWIAASSSYVEGFSVGPPSSDARLAPRTSSAEPLSADDRHCTATGFRGWDLRARADAPAHALAPTAAPAPPAAAAAKRSSRSVTVGAYRPRRDGRPRRRLRRPRGPRAASVCRCT